MITLVEGNNEINVNLTPIAAPVANLLGTVYDTTTNRGVGGALVKLGSLSAYTDSGGNFAFYGLDPGSYSGSVSASGYQTAYF